MEAFNAATRHAPGVALVAALTALAFAGAHFTSALGIGAVALGVLAGLLAGNLGSPGPALRPGIRFVGRHVLAVAVALLGLRIALVEVARFGVPLTFAVAAVAGAVVLALLVGRLVGVPARMSLLLGAGTGVCGVAAIAAVRPVVGGRQEETTYAVAAVALLGSLGLVVFPLVQIAWHPLAPDGFGLLAGGSLHSVPQAIGAGFAGGGEEAGTVATLVKLTRVVLLVPLVLVLVAACAGRGRTEGGVPRLPVEVWGFLFLVVLGNLVPLPGAILEAAVFASDLLLVAAITALGVSTRFRELHRVGVRPLVVAGAVWMLVVVAMFGVLRFL